MKYIFEFLLPVDSILAARGRQRWIFGNFPKKEKFREIKMNHRNKSKYVMFPQKQGGKRLENPANNTRCFSTFSV